jgi:hypothetical protein
MPAISEIPSNRPYWLQYLFNKKMFSLSHRYTIGDSESVYFQFKTGANPRYLAHVIERTMDVEAGGPIYLEIIEAPTLTDGTLPPDTFSNMDRRLYRDTGATRPSDASAYINPTNISGGLLFDTDFLTTGGGPKTSGSIKSGITERPLRPNTDYILKFTNEGSQDSSLHLKIVWYESLE